MATRYLGRVTGVSAACDPGGVIRSGARPEQCRADGHHPAAAAADRGAVAQGRRAAGTGAAGDREGRHGHGDGAEGRGGSARHQGQVGARADLLEQGRQLVGARARPPAGRRRRARRRRRLLQERQRHRAALRAPRHRGQLLSRAGSTSSRPTSPTAPSTSRTPTSSTAASSSSPPTSASVSTRRRTRSRS